VPGFGQRLDDIVPDFGVVFYDQHAHGSTVSLFS
jgi:hypothetical protein